MLLLARCSSKKVNAPLVLSGAKIKQFARGVLNATELNSKNQYYLDNDFRSAEALVKMECKAPYGHKCNQECQYCEHTKPSAGAAGSLADGHSCGHPGCLQHVSHPCEGCGRIAGQSDEKLKVYANERWARDMGFRSW